MAERKKSKFCYRVVMDFSVESTNDLTLDEVVKACEDKSQYPYHGNPSPEILVRRRYDSEKKEYTKADNPSAVVVITGISILNIEEGEYGITK